MSRRSSLRLDDSLMERSLQLSSSYSTGGAWKNSRSLKSRHSALLSASCSESLLLQTPPLPVRSSRPPIASSSALNSSLSLHSVTSDASLLSSMLDESSFQETTMVNTFWGLDQDVEPKESTIIEEPGSSLVIGPEGRRHSDSVQTLSRVNCSSGDRNHDNDDNNDNNHDNNDHHSTTCSSSKHTHSRSHTHRHAHTHALPNAHTHAHRHAHTHAMATHYEQPDTSTVYCRDRHRKNNSARPSSVCGNMKMRETATNQKDKKHPNGSLCDDCREKERSESSSSSSSSSSWFSLAVCVLGTLGMMMWSAAVFTGKTSADVFRCLNRRLRHVFSSFRFTWLTLALLGSLLLFCLYMLGPVSLLSILPSVNVTAWTTSVPPLPDMTSLYSLISTNRKPEHGVIVDNSQSEAEEKLYSQSEEGIVEEAELHKTIYSRPPHTGESESGSESASDGPSERLIGLEQSVTSLWNHLEAGSVRAESRHAHVLRLYTQLQQAQGGLEVKKELSGLLEEQLEHIRTRLDEDRLHREQTVLQQQKQSSRLDQLELQLKTLAAQTQEVKSNQEASASTLPSAVSVGVDRVSHDALLSEVSRLEAALKEVRRDVKELSGCKQLDTIQHTISTQVSAQVRELVRTFFFGNQLSVRGGDSATNSELPPESLLQFIEAQSFITADGLRGALSETEARILHNISTHLEKKRRKEEEEEEDTDAHRENKELQTDREAGDSVTLEDVQVLVEEALRKFSEDRTGLADYALESGGGSVVSTRCSETYETKAALITLFGLPLWYFSQSPRAVIQPDVNPGNCWPFRGSSGFLVVRLSMRIVPSSFSLEHLPRALTPNRARLSAPRDFTVYGLDDEHQQNGTLLGSFTYQQEGEALQTYRSTEQNGAAFQMIEVQFLSNWGHQNYTCIYRFRVHGTPAQ